ncbi:hypothetical protein J3492_12290 [Psychrobacter sp. F1192]|uniref:Uncharacterized protein n=1 Tax=Psychrobacter coccoides TaxID=2818440 RepID=A0ABS3NRD4_9GAMM|nr:hypothetical protein [Psychrobacter coccoides]MBO1531981.1 hypothetical protein [Psychrobacter coccoides]
MKSNILLDHPTEKLVKQYIDKFELDERYKYGDSAIIKLFTAFPYNTSLEDIILKVSVVNELYSTSIYSVFRVAQHILKCDIDENIKAGNPKTVHQIATGHNIRTKKHNTEINFYSFATKYCNWHNQTDYSIYDSFVEKTLMAYKKRDGFSEFKKKDLKDFEKFHQVILDFVDYYSLNGNNAKDIDKFLWIYGKEKFPPSYKDS